MQIIPLIIIILSFSLIGCSQKIPECEPEKIYVKTNVPRLKILYSVPRYQIKDFKPQDNTYYLVNKKELHKASSVSQKRIHNINFYEKQNRDFNKKFGDK